MYEDVEEALKNLIADGKIVNKDIKFSKTEGNKNGPGNSDETRKYTDRKGSDIQSSGVDKGLFGKLLQRDKNSTASNSKANATRQVARLGTGDELRNSKGEKLTNGKRAKRDGSLKKQMRT